MHTIDTLLLQIINFSSPVIEECVSLRDAKVLRSLALSVSNENFITENQSKLLIKLLRENTAKISHFSQEIKECLISPAWSKPFRKIEQVRIP